MKRRFDNLIDLKNERELLVRKNAQHRMRFYELRKEISTPGTIKKLAYNSLFSSDASKSGGRSSGIQTAFKQYGGTALKMLGFLWGSKFLGKGNKWVNLIMALAPIGLGSKMNMSKLPSELLTTVGRFKDHFSQRRHQAAERDADLPPYDIDYSTSLER